MRVLAVVTLAAAIAAAACAPKIVPAPIVTTPRFPEFVPPSVPPELSSNPAAVSQERAWRFLQAGDIPTAEREAGLALRLTPDFYPADATLGYVELARNAPDLAVTHFDRALARRGDYTSAHVGRGQALSALNREQEAISAFEAALAVDPSLVDLRRRVEVLKFRGLQRDLDAARQAARSGNADEAARLYQAAIASSPDSAFLYRELAVVERDRGNRDAALAHFRRAVELEPGDAPSIAEIGRLLEASGDVDAALRAYDEALAIEPNESVEASRAALRARLELAALPEEYRAIETASQITRADLAALIGVRLAPVLQAASPRDAVVITDVRSNWAEQWIMAVARSGVIEPYENHTFQPRTLVRRVDLAEAVDRLLGEIATPGQMAAWRNARVTFSDVSPGHLAYPAASAAVASGVMAASPGQSFQPSRPVSGAEAIDAIGRLQAMAGLTANSGNRR
jgi:tetratricopeptide (TPR) repeat protein